MQQPYFKSNSVQTSDVNPQKVEKAQEYHASVGLSSSALAGGQPTYKEVVVATALILLLVLLLLLLLLLLLVVVVVVKSEHRTQRSSEYWTTGKIQEPGSGFPSNATGCKQPSFKKIHEASN
jgi:hypothetical protein